MFRKEWEVTIALSECVNIHTVVLEAETEKEAKIRAIAQVYESGIEIPFDIDDEEMTAVVTGVYGGKG
jgi:phosphatidate phosphatase APP1